MWFNGDETDVQQLFENASSVRLNAVFGYSKTIIIDEAQRIGNIGSSLKLITDELKEIQVVATGSSGDRLY
jgi:predicted AAA+ superfamily ATPase